MKKKKKKFKIYRKTAEKILNREKKERAKICLNCNYNYEGYCNKFKAWGFKVNYICNGTKNPYEYKF